MNGRRYFSGYIRAIAEATDHDTAMKVALEWGGRRVRIPTNVTPYCALARLVGPEKAAAIVANLGGEVINIAHEKTNLVHWLRERGLSQQDIAHELKMGLRSVQHVLNGTMPRHFLEEGADA
jgi:hypothetical protein